MDWRFLHAAPPHYTASRVAPGSIVIDGRLDDAAWQTSAWTTSFVDITRHYTRPALNVVPQDLQTRAKVLWDGNFVYIAAELREPFITANVTGHNGPTPPYHDNDFVRAWRLNTDVSRGTGLGLA